MPIITSGTIITRLTKIEKATNLAYKASKKDEIMLIIFLANPSGNKYWKIRISFEFYLKSKKILIEVIP